MPKPSTRERNPAAKRARIAQAALKLFKKQGYAETTIDQIAAAARVGRRTIFEHFPTKEAILFDHLVVRREATLQRLRERPASEPPLVSLHAVMRQLCEEGYERAYLDQIRAVLATELQRMVISSANSVPVLWYSRLVAHVSNMKGWKIVPTHFANQDLADVWLDQ